MFPCRREAVRVFHIQKRPHVSLDTRGLCNKIINYLRKNCPRLGHNNKTNNILAILNNASLQTFPKSIIVLDECVADIAESVLPFAHSRKNAYLSVSLLEILRTHGRLNTSAILFSVIVIVLFTFHPFFLCVVTPPGFCHQPGDYEA